MSNLSRLERIGLLAGIATGVAGAVFGGLGLIQAQQTQREALESQKAEQANRVVASIVPSDNGILVLVQNFSPLPVFRMSFVAPGRDSMIGTLPPCQQFDITSAAVPQGEDWGWSDGVPEIALEFTDAAGRTWYRVADDVPRAGSVPSSVVRKLNERASGGSSSFGLAEPEPITGGCGSN